MQARQKAINTSKVRVTTRVRTSYRASYRVRFRAEVKIMNTSYLNGVQQQDWLRIGYTRICTNRIEEH